MSKKQKVPYKPKHPELLEYNENFINKFLDPKLVEFTKNAKCQDASKVTTEVVEQIYQFQLFTPEFCKLVIEEADYCDKWHTELEDTTVDHPVSDGVVEEDAPSTELPLNKIGMDAVYHKIADNHIQPLVEALWKSFGPTKRDMPFMLKYDMGVIKEMKLHYDCETVALVIYLNKDFNGGGTGFPKFGITVGEVIDGKSKFNVGTAVIYPGGVSHEHTGVQITSGVRYLMLGCFY